MMTFRKVAVITATLGGGWFVGFWLLGILGLFGDPNKPMTIGQILAAFVPAAALCAVAGVCELVYRCTTRKSASSAVSPVSQKEMPLTDSISAETPEDTRPAEEPRKPISQETSERDAGPQISATTARVFGVAQLAIIPALFVMLRGEPGAEDWHTRLLLAYAIWGAFWGFIVCWPLYLRTVNHYSSGKHYVFNYIYWFGPYMGVAIFVGFLGGGIYGTIKCLLYKDIAPEEETKKATTEQDGLVCPRCGSGVKPDEHMATGLKCPQCGEFFRLSRSIFDDIERHG